MKFSCTQSNLINALYSVSNIVGKNVSLPILNNVLISAKQGKIRLISTNLDIGIKTSLRGKIEQEGEITIPAKLFMEYVNLIKDQTINLALQENDLLIKTENQQTVIKGQSADEYPIVPDIEDGDLLEVESNEFKNALAQVIFAASYDNIRPELTGVYFEIYQGELVLAATDSYRLAEKKIKISNNTVKLSKIIPVRVLQEVLRLLKDEIKVKFGFSDNQVIFELEETKIISRLIEGNYPQYHEIIPKEYKTKIEINKEEIINGIKVSSLFSKSGINDVILDFNSKKGEVNISAANVQLGENKTVLKTKINGENNSVVFNYKYLLDGLQNINSKQVTIEIVNADSPAVIKPQDKDDYLYLIMPIRK